MIWLAAIAILLLIALCFALLSYNKTSAIKNIDVLRSKTREKKLKESLAKDSYVLGDRACANRNTAIGNCIATLIVFGVGLLVTFIGITAQINNIENAKKYLETEAIFAEKSSKLTTEFAQRLALDYPNHEKNIFSDIKPGNIKIYLAKYPGLRAADTVLALVASINKLESDMYAQKVKRVHMEKEIRFNLRNPWYFTILIPAE